MIDVFERLLPSTLMSIPTREYGLTALAKLVTRFESGVDRVQALIRSHTAHMHLELQQRSVEFNRLLGNEELK